MDSIALVRARSRAPGRHAGFHLFSDVGEAVRNGDAHGLAGKFVLAAAGDKAIGDEIAAGTAVFLHDSEEAVVVGEEEAGGGDESGGTAAGTDGGGQQSGAARGVPQARDGELESLLFEPLRGKLEELLGSPFALFGEGEGEGDAQAGGPSEGFTELHSLVPGSHEGQVRPGKLGSGVSAFCGSTHDCGGWPFPVFIARKG